MDAPLDADRDYSAFTGTARSRPGRRTRGSRILPLRSFAAAYRAPLCPCYALLLLNTDSRVTLLDCGEILATREDASD